MRRTEKTWMIIAAFAVLLGMLIFGGVMTVLKWDFTKLSTGKYETTTYEIDEIYQDISIVTNTADIVFLPSENGKTEVVCYDQTNMRHEVSVADGEMVIEVADVREWYEYIGIHFKTPKITVYMPHGEYNTLWINSDTGDVEIPKDFKFKDITIEEDTGDVTNHASATGCIKIKTDTGNICVENMSAGALDLSVSTGKVTVSEISCAGDVKIHVSTGKTLLTDVQCQNVISSGSTGAISLENVIATGKFSIERSTGDVKFARADAAEIFVETDTGDITGTLLSEKIFLPRSSTGHIDVPKTVTGGRCEISTDTGNIKISVSN